MSDLIETASRGVSSAELRSRAPQRYGDVSRHAPVVIWNVCMHCNMSCPHCYAAAVSSPSPADLSRSEALRLIDEMAACGIRVLIFSGGEPLLRDDLFDLIGHARAAGISPQLSTNGVRIDAGVAEKLAGLGVAYVGVSIDGLEAFNDAYRGLPGGFAAALRGLEHAKRAGMRTGLRMTLTRRNLDQLAAMADVAEQAQADRLYISHLVYSGRGFHVSGDDLSREQARAALTQLFELAEQQLVAGRGPRIVTGSNDSDGVFLLHWIDHRFGREAAARVRGLLLERGGNSAGEKIINIDSSGRVHPDQFWRSAVLGDVRRQPLAEILRHTLREQLARRLEYLEGRCALCSERDLCRGSHRERALAHSRNVWASDPACVLLDSEIAVAAPAREVA